MRAGSQYRDPSPFPLPFVPNRAPFPSVAASVPAVGLSGRVTVLARMRPRQRVAEEFATRHFAGCERHAAEAAAFFEALERLAGPQVATLDPDAALREVLAEPPPAEDSLEAVEREMALDQPLMKALLGSAAAGCSWDPAQMWARSARGVINERVRLQGGGCSCG